MTHRNHALSLPRNERGVALFAALVALAAISLAAVALVRSVDTVNLAAGNLSFKKSALLGSDAGVENAITFLNGQATLGGLNGHMIPQGYYSTYNTATTVSNPISIATDVQGRPAGWPVTLPQDAAGNTTSFIVQRMCTNNLVAGDTADRIMNCVTGIPEKCHVITGCALPPPVIYYRITTQVQGPRNTVAFVQAIVSKP